MNRENQNEPSTVDEIFRKIEKKVDTGEYLYRGEPKHYQDDPYYGKISSNFYRVFLKDEDFDVEAAHFDIEELQTAVLSISKQFSRKPVDELERLSEIQHYGGKTKFRRTLSSPYWYVYKRHTVYLSKQFTTTSMALLKIRKTT